MRRREFMAFGGACGGAAILAPMKAFAQQQRKVMRVSVLMGTIDDAEGQARVAALKTGMRDLNWLEGTTIAYDVRWTAGDAALAHTLVTETIGRKPDIIVGVNSPVMRVLKQATHDIPIVFAGLSDPVGDGIVASLARPGGNITGFSSFEPAMAGKWLQLLHEIVPGLKRVAVMYNPRTAPHTLFWPTLEATARTRDLALVRATVDEQPAIEPVLAGMVTTPGTGLVMLPDSFVASHRMQIYGVLDQYRLPAVWPIPYHAASGGLVAYGPDFSDQFQRAASYVDRILRGTSTPSDLPVQQPVKFQLKINLKAAKAIGVSVPTTLLATADEVIE